MLYTTASSLTVNFTIKPAQIANAIASQYTLEVINMLLGTKHNYPAAGVVAPTTSPLANGNATFNNVQLPNDGVYQMNVYYANDGDLDVASSVTCVGGGSVLKVTSASTMTIV